MITLSEYTQELYKQMKERMTKILDDKKKECMSSIINRDSSMLSSSSRITVETVILVGDADEKIIEFANEKRVDLIVIGSRGLRGISKFFKALGLGSVSRSVSERVTCPVLIIR